jgi:hypothetical protein
MIYAVGSGILWLAVAVLVLCGARRSHAPTGWALAIAAIPVLGLITLECGPFWGLISLIVAMGLLRGPLRPVLGRSRRAVE